MPSAAVRPRLLLLVVAAAAVEAGLLFIAWPIAVLAGIAGGTAFALVVGLRLQRDADAVPRSDLFDDAPADGPLVDAPLVDAPLAVAA